MPPSKPRAKSWNSCAARFRKRADRVGCVYFAAPYAAADVTLSREPVDILKEQKINAEWALKQQSDKLAAQFDSIEDDYLRERKQDMLQVVRRIHNNLVGQSNDLNLTEGLFEDTILIAHDLSPADTVLFKEQRITAFVTDVAARPATPPS